MVMSDNQDSAYPELFAGQVPVAEDWDTEQLFDWLTTWVPVLVLAERVTEEERVQVGHALWLLRRETADEEYSRCIAKLQKIHGVTARTLRRWRQAAEEQMGLIPSPQSSLARGDHRPQAVTQDAEQTFDSANLETNPQVSPGGGHVSATVNQELEEEDDGWIAEGVQALAERDAASAKSSVEDALQAAFVQGPPVEEPPAEELPVTEDPGDRFAPLLAEAERHGFQQGYEQGVQAGRTQGHEQGWAEGFEAGRLQGLTEARVETNGHVPVVEETPW